MQQKVQHKVSLATVVIQFLVWLVSILLRGELHQLIELIWSQKRRHHGVTTLLLIIGFLKKSNNLIVSECDWVCQGASILHGIRGKSRKILRLSSQILQVCWDGHLLAQ